MSFIKHVSLFIKKLMTQLRRKWLSLPLILLFPILIIGMVFTIIFTFITPSEQAPINIGLVDLDQSEETELILSFISESTELGSFITVNQMTEIEARDKMNQNELHVYVTFPGDFTTHLYEGEPVNLTVIGNEKHPTESYLVNEIIKSMTRLISAAQANILTINHYAKELSIDADTRSDMLFEQFKDFLFYTLAKDKIIEKEVLINYATSSPLYYYALGAWFMISLIWLLVFYNFLYTKDTIRMKRRIKLYGVTELQEKVARISVTLLTVSFFSALSFISLKLLLKLEFLQEDYLRLSALFLLHSIIFLTILAITETVIASDKIRLLCQSILMLVLTIMSGVIVPIIYFPLIIQEITQYIFSYNAFFWIKEIILNDRYYTDFLPLILNSLMCLIILISLSIWKERVEV